MPTSGGGKKKGRFSPLGDTSPLEYIQALPIPSEAFLTGFSQTSPEVMGVRRACAHPPHTLEKHTHTPTHTGELIPYSKKNPKNKKPN